MNFEAETQIDAAKLQKTAAERASGESCRSEFREKSAAANQNFPGSAADDRDFISAVFGANVSAFPCPATISSCTPSVQPWDDQVSSSALAGQVTRADP